MPERGTFWVGSDPKIRVEVRYSPWRHNVFVSVNGVPLHESLTWKSPGGEWSVPLDSAPQHPLVIGVRCFNEKAHFPHAHVLDASWGESHLRLAPDWIEPLAVPNRADPPFVGPGEKFPLEIVLEQRR
ncbi:MAG: hypothetical protein ACREDK_09240 [Thermoplasmata archaeon]